MCSRLLLLLLALILPAASLRAEDFETDIPPKFTYSETYRDSVVIWDAEFGDYEVIPRTTLKVTAVCSMKGVPLSSIDESTVVSIDFDGLVEEWTLGDDPNYSKGKTSAKIPLYGWDPVTGEDKQLGSVSVVWNTKTVTIAFTAEDDPDSYQVMAQDRAYEGIATDAFRDEVMFTVGFAGRELTGRTAYITGTISYADYENGDIFETLARVSLQGAIDSDPPNLTMLKPLAGIEVNEEAFTLTGTVSDSAQPTVYVTLNGGEELEATVDAAGNWSLPVIFTPGTNTIVVRAVDAEGNVATLKPRTVTFTRLSSLTVMAEGDGSGQVTSTSFEPLKYTPGFPSPERIKLLAEGSTLVATATPGPDALFERWISNYPLPNATSPRLQFTMAENMTLIARFVPNIFYPVKGSYSGLLDSSSPEGRGFISLNLATSGSFTGSIRLGTSTIRLKGKFATDGTFVGIVKAGKQSFDLTLSLASSEGGSKQVVGTFQPHTTPDSLGAPVALPFTSAITADLGVYKKKVREVSVELAGSYNVLFEPASTNTDVNFPVGIGFGRVTLSKYGAAKLVGKLGDGTAVTASAPLAEDGYWPVYAPLYAKKGAVAGRAKFDLLQGDSDISGTLAWYRPAKSAPVHAEGFAGQLQLTGAKYVRPAAGQRLFLNPNGEGALSFDAPAGGGSLSALSLGSEANLSNSNQLTASDTALDVKTAFNVTTGLFTGTFLDPSQNKRLKFSGAVVIGGSTAAPKGNRAGGFFIRGNRTGAVELIGPVRE